MRIKSFICIESQFYIRQRTIFARVYQLIFGKKRFVFIPMAGGCVVAWMEYSAIQDMLELGVAPVLGFRQYGLQISSLH